ncbi:hypothetical protein K435DRAFT_892462 [Dendrothele bispora CBS 962.96]|uniref:Uncharacterized protein n=1 Tax=Dendrothele bispora (strain CBS 962.96) TaxID=1314807 RepID=A0A4S8M338_DENBC|nr:hypothetical protein K435DRAFT_892462 [Dendrothele bispora CBS 962.96]
MGSTTIEESSMFNVEIGLLGPVISVSLIFGNTGFYVFLFGLSTYFLLKHRVISRRRLHLLWTTSLFTISSFGSLMSVINHLMNAVVIYNALRTQSLDHFQEYNTRDKAPIIMM